MSPMACKNGKRWHSHLLLFLSLTIPGLPAVSAVPAVQPQPQASSEEKGDYFAFKYHQAKVYHVVDIKKKVVIRVRPDCREEFALRKLDKKGSGWELEMYHSGSGGWAKESVTISASGGFVDLSSSWRMPNRIPVEVLPCTSQDCLAKKLPDCGGR